MKEIQDLSLRYFCINQKVNIIEKKKCISNKEGSVYCHMTKNG